MWQLDGEVASLSGDGIAASIDLNQPDVGVTQVHAPGGPLPVEQMCGVAWARHDGSQAILVDRYVRGLDLVARYENSLDRSLSCEVYWRLLGQAHSKMLGIEVIVSAQTKRLKADPAVTVAASIAADEILTTEDALQGTLQTIDLRQVRQHQLPGSIFIFRASNTSVSYVEVVHPADLLANSIAAASAGQFRVTHQLFRDTLEKGVIRRGRVRCLIVPRKSDAEVALENYAELTQASPPLTT